jgi:hypothetical protein
MAGVRKVRASSLKLVDSFIDLVLSGVKTTTIRQGIVFIDGNTIPLISESRTIWVKILRVDHTKTLGDLTEADAILDGFESLVDLQRQLEKFYGEIGQEYINITPLAGCGS